MTIFANNKFMDIMRVRVLWAFLLVAATMAAQDFKLNESGYYTAGGTDVMAFSDFYPEGHQGGVSILINGWPVTVISVWRRRPVSGSPCPSN